MNIYDVSQKAGVSIATVSRVLNGNSNVSEKTRQKVLSVMQELGYTPNVFARGLGLNSMRTVGIMCSDSSDPFLANAVYYLERSLRKCNYEAFLCCTGSSLENKKNDLELLLSKRVDAVILVGSQYIELNNDDNAYLLDAAERVPLIMINGFLSHPHIYGTLCDDYRAIYDTVSRLAEHGHRRLLFLYRSDSISSRTKKNGFLDAVSRLDLPQISDQVMICSENISETKRMLLDRFPSVFPFDGIIAAEDCLAVGAVKFASAKGLQLPTNLEIIGYNNSTLCLCTEPELSTIDNHVEALCETSVNTLMRVLGGHDAPNKITLSTDYIARRTSY